MHPLIYDWNATGRSPSRATVMLDDETLRDGLQSPSVQCPTIEREARASCTSSTRSASTPRTSACPAPGRTSSGTSSGWRARSPTQRLRGDGQLRGADARRRHQADRGDLAARRHADRVLHVHRVEPAAAVRRRAGRIDQLLRLTEEAITFAVREGLPVMYVTEDTTRADPETLRAALFDGDPRRRVARVHRRHGRPRDAGGRRGGRPLRRAGRRGVRRRRRHRLARPSRPRPRGRSTRWRRSRPGRRGCTAPAIGIGERVGNTPMDMLLVNLVLMGYIERDLSALVEYCEAVSAATGVPIPAELPGRRPRRVPHRDRRARRGGDQGVPEEGSRARRCGLFGRARQPGRPRAGDRGRPDVGQVERGLLAGEARPAGDRRDRRADLREGEGVDDRARRRRRSGARELDRSRSATQESQRRVASDVEPITLWLRTLRIARS